MNKGIIKKEGGIRVRREGKMERERNGKEKEIMVRRKGQGNGKGKEKAKEEREGREGKLERLSGRKVSISVLYLHTFVFVCLG